MSCERKQDLGYDPTCQMSVDDHLRVFSDLLPQGRVWPRDAESTLMRFWRSAAEVVKFASDRICALSDEFFCSTAVETIATWETQYAISRVLVEDADAACLKENFDELEFRRNRVCSAIIDQGGNTAAYFEEALSARGWIVTVEDIGASYKPHMAGCMQAGCVPLGTTAVPIQNGTELGYDATDNRWVGRAVEHPYPDEWRDKAPIYESSCGIVPGSSLGVASLGSEECCNHAGYWNYPEIDDDSTSSSSSSGMCSGSSATEVIYPAHDAPGSIRFPYCDETGGFQEYSGQAHAIKVTVDIEATLQAFADASPFVNYWATAGCAMAGDSCARPRSLDYDELEALIIRVVPAHVDYHIDYNHAGSADYDAITTEDGSVITTEDGYIIFHEGLAG